MFYETLESMVLATAEAVRPPERLTVSQAAAKYRKLDNAGSYRGPWLNEKTPYLVEPMDELNSRLYTGMIYVGPAQCGKTDMLLNWIAYSAKCDPADMMVIQTSQATARDFSKRRVDKMFRVSKEIAALRIPGRQNQNVFDTMFLSGMYLTLSWPTINELSGKPIPRLWATDYDRVDEDIDGEGNLFDLGRKRATTFKRFGMMVAESSPGKPIDDPKWKPGTPHEAPPTKGILALYNRGDRRRWYWRCLQCDDKFEPKFERMLASLPPKFDVMTCDIMDIAEQACVVCPDCSFPMVETMRSELNIGGRWIKDGMLWTREGEIIGKASRSDIASFWMFGPSAALAEWRTLVANYLNALREYERTGSEEALKTTVNVDQGDAYLPKAMGETRLPEKLKENVIDVPLGSVPQWVRFIIACIDVQKNRFVVQVHGFGPGGDMHVIDRFDIKTSTRIDENAQAEGQFLWVKPGSFLEDWDLLIEQVLTRDYPIHEDPNGRRMQVKMTTCDSGGMEGVTKNAYDFYRRLKENDDLGMLWQRFRLTKGDPKPARPRVMVSFPDSDRKDRRAGARGEVPVILLNTNMLKDTVDHLLDRDKDKGGRITYGKGLVDSFFVELTVEIKNIKGVWENPKQYRNESWDLLVMAHGVSISQYIAIERLDWENPPSWAAEYTANDLVHIPAGDGAAPFTPVRKPTYDLRALAERLV